jgi:hypothetical protein
MRGSHRLDRNNKSGGRVSAMTGCWAVIPALGSLGYPIGCVATESPLQAVTDVPHGTALDPEFSHLISSQHQSSDCQHPSRRGWPAYQMLVWFETISCTALVTRIKACRPKTVSTSSPLAAKITCKLRISNSISWPVLPFPPYPSAEVWDSGTYAIPPR